MTKKTSRRRMERSQADSYRASGAEFMKAARLAVGNGCWNAAGVLFVHASIAYADAVCIALAGMKSTRDNHLDAVALLGEATAQVRDRDQAISHLRRVIEEKNRASYLGQSYRDRDTKSMEIHAVRFSGWADRVLQGVTGR